MPVAPGDRWIDQPGATLVKFKRTDRGGTVDRVLPVVIVTRHPHRRDFVLHGKNFTEGHHLLPREFLLWGESLRRGDLSLPSTPGLLLDYASSS